MAETHDRTCPLCEATCGLEVVVDGGRAVRGALLTPVEVTDAVMRGVVSLPHGWGHSVDGIRMDVAERHAGVNSNVLSGHDAFDPLSGNAVLNGIPVTATPA